MSPHRNPEWFMRRALRLAARGFGRTSPNPMVGAVVVRNGEIVGEGFHLYAKRHHAEVVALRQAGPRARGADLYVTLEPCSHFGRTPPCVETVVQSGVRRVLIAVEDPNPLVQGRGIDYLRRNGIEVDLGTCRAEAAELNAAFFHFIAHQRPYVTLKLAMSLDGKIASRTGQSKWITGPEARQAAHRLRYGSDAILVGIETVLSDDPSLDVRWRHRNRISKVVLDSSLRCPPGARLFESGDPVILFHRAGLPGSQAAFEGRAELAPVDPQAGSLSWPTVLDELGRRNIVSLLVEGGSRVATTLLQQRLANRIAFFYGPLVLGADGLSAVGDLGIDHLSESLRFVDIKVRRLGDSVLVSGIPEYREPGG